MKIIKGFKGLVVIMMAAFVLTACGGGAVSKGFVSSEEGRFSVEFPDAPKLSSVVQPSDVGDITINSYAYEIDDKNGYVLMYMDFPTELMEASDPKVLLEDGLNGQLQTFGADLNVEKKEEISIDGNPGLYARAIAGDFYAITKDYLVGNRAYILMMVKSGAYASEEEEAAFLGTFKLLK